MRKVVEVIVQWLERPGKSFAEEIVEPPLDLAGIKANSQRLRLAQLRRHLRQHGQAARHVKAANGHIRAGRSKTAGEIQGAGKLIGLHAGQTDEAMTRRPDLRGDFFGADAGVGLVIDENFQRHIGAERLAATAVLGDGVQGRQGIGGNGGTQPLHHITVVVVMRGFDQMQLEHGSAHSDPFWVLGRFSSGAPSGLAGRRRAGPPTARQCLEPIAISSPP